MTFIAYYQPEDRAAYQREISRKLAIVAGLSPEGPSEFIIRKAAIEKPVKAHVAHVTRSSNNYNNEDEKAILGRKLAIVAGIL